MAAHTSGALAQAYYTIIVNYLFLGNLKFLRQEEEVAVWLLGMNTINALIAPPTYINLS